MVQVIVLFGPPGAGKGTLAQEIEKEFNIKHLSFGEVLREIAKQNTPLGLRVKHFLDKGLLVDDETVNQVISETLKQYDFVLLDGYPRTISQAKYLETIAKVLAVVFVNASEETIINRISTRRICEKCGKVYNLITSPPKIEGKCDVCGGNLIQRDDDKPEVIKKRLDEYHKNTQELYNYYKTKNILYEVSSESDLSTFYETGKEVFRRILNNKDI